MNLPSPGTVVTIAAVAIALFLGFRWLSNESDNTSGAIVNSITTPIDKAARGQAEANVRSALPAIQLYFVEQGAYVGISTDKVRAIDAGLSPSVQILPEDQSFCVTATVRAVTVHQSGPSGELLDGPCTGIG